MVRIASRDYGVRVSNPEQLVRTAAKEAQQRLDAAFAAKSADEIRGTGFDQAGLKNGLEIVESHLKNGELGVAYEHALYMVVETGIALSDASVLAMEQVAAALGLPMPRLRHDR